MRRLLMKLMPLISARSIYEMLPHEFRASIKLIRTKYRTDQETRKLAKAPAPKSPIKDINYRINKHGNPIITIRNRKPKWITPDEINILASFHGVAQNEMWTIIRSKNIPVSKSTIQASIKD